MKVTCHQSNVHLQKEENVNNFKKKKELATLMIEEGKKRSSQVQFTADDNKRTVPTGRIEPSDYRGGRRTRGFCNRCQLLDIIIIKGGAVVGAAVWAHYKGGYFADQQLLHVRTSLLKRQQSRRPYSTPLRRNSEQSSSFRRLLLLHFVYIIGPLL